MDRTPDLSLSERAVADIAVRVAGRRMTNREMLRAFSSLGWLATLNDGWFYFWSPKSSPYTSEGESRCHRVGMTNEAAWRHDLLVEMELAFKTTADELY